ncbi:MAG: MBL fold metallo-hydrolase [Leptospirillum sp.]|jgi:hypothetical protein
MSKFNTSKFIALPVGQGDAFYLERQNMKVLVDGGKSKSAISNLLRSNIAERSHLDAVICTHNDADHANGIIGLLDNWLGEIKEVWLPGSWTFRMKDLFEDSALFLDEFINSLYTKEKNKFDSIENSFTEFSEKPEERSKGSEFNLDKIIENSKSFHFDTLGGPFLFSNVRPLINPRDTRRIKLFCEATEAVSRIRDIIVSAYDRGCRIRFFEFGSKPVWGGRTGLLEPVNSREIDILDSIRIGAFEYLALTTANKQSLVFYALENDGHPAVLFSADSDLDFPLPSSIPLKSPIITAPHHGSESNSNAYNAISNWLCNTNIKPIWIRSDGKSRSRPGGSFKKQSTRACTLCNCGTTPKQTVQLDSQMNQWQFTNGMRMCSCT